MPHQVGDIKKIESVQALFTRLVCRKLDVKYDSYKYRLSFLSLDTLDIRQIKYDLILFFTFFYNLVDLKFDDFFFISSSLKLYRLRRNILHLNKPVLGF